MKHPFSLLDVVFLFGCVATAIGFWWVWPPLGLIVPGVGMVLASMCLGGRIKR